ncbi:MAG: hypothetical protein ACRCSP_02085 [Rhodoglobus sp.]
MIVIAALLVPLALVGIIATVCAIGSDGYGRIPTRAESAHRE